MVQFGLRRCRLGASGDLTVTKRAVDGCAGAEASGKACASRGGGVDRLAGHDVVATVDVKHLTGDRTGQWAAKKEDSVGDLFR